jgi:alkanesulfonate monooxygenase SsuD/methylene tetrahydromethanopterin reductase-like flavin-dependent oxidoreductase (luciferase family)
MLTSIGVWCEDACSSRPVDQGDRATAMADCHQQVADLIEDYAARGVGEFIMSGYPHVEEAIWFGEGVLPELWRRGLLGD